MPDIDVKLKNTVILMFCKGKGDENGYRSKSKEKRRRRKTKSSKIRNKETVRM